MTDSSLMGFKPIETERLRLRPLRLADGPTVQRYAGARDVAKTVINIPHPYEDGIAEKWIAATHDALARGDQIHLAVILRGDAHGNRPDQGDADGGADPCGSDEGLQGDSAGDQFIGAVGLAINKQNHAAELGYWIGKPYWNNGYGTEATRALVAYGFRQLELNRIQARHMMSNPASGRIMQKLGMSYEGTHRQAALRFGSYEDLAVYAILRSEYEAQSM